MGKQVVKVATPSKSKWQKVKTLETEASRKERGPKPKGEKRN